MATDGSDFRRLANAFRDFDRRAEVVKALRKAVQQPVPIVRERIKASARATLPSGGGLNRWVAASKITSAVAVVSGRGAGVRIRMGRRSTSAQSDIAAINRGRLRRPSWGRRGRGQWHTQAVTPEFFSRPIRESTEWPEAIDRAVSEAWGKLGG